jgi:hypothetical protein
MCWKVAILSTLPPIAPISAWYLLMSLVQQTIHTYVDFGPFCIAVCRTRGIRSRPTRCAPQNWIVVCTYKTEPRQGKLQGNTVKSIQSLFDTCKHCYVLCLNPVLYTSHITMYRYAPHNDDSVNDRPHTRRWSHKIYLPLCYNCIQYSVK